MEFLAIPCKRTLSVDLLKNLGDLINKISLQNPSLFQNDLNFVDQLRNNILDTDLSDQSLTDHVSYYYLIDNLIKKFPSDQIGFTWYQTLSTSSISSNQYSFQWDQVNVLYNIASLYSLRAIDLNLSNNGSYLTKQCKYFQLSAIIINFIVINYNSNLSRDQEMNLSSSNAPVADTPTLLSLKFLMLAQAMECFWQKAIKDNLKDKIVGKMSSQIVQFYEDTIRYGKKSILIRSDWIDKFEDKKLYFQAVTFYRMAKDYHTRQKYGFEIFCYQSASTCLEQCGITSDNFRSKIYESLHDVERDNDFIYHQAVPSDPVSLIEPLSMVNIDLNMRETLFKNISIDFKKIDRLFYKLLPLEVMEYVTVFKERQQQHIQERIISPLCALNKLLKDKMLEITTNDTSVIKLANIHSIPIEELDKYKYALSDLKQNQINVQNQLNYIETMLNDEEELDRKFRHKYGSLVTTIVESSTVNKPYWDKLNMLRQYLKQGLEVDMKTMEVFETIDKDLISADIKLHVNNDPFIEKINDTIEKRDTYISQLENKKWDNSILPELIDEYRLSNSVSNFESIYLSHLNATFKESMLFIESEKKINQDLISAIALKKQEAKENYRNDATIKRLTPRDLYIEEFKFSLKLLEQVKSNIIDASKFYEDLINSVNNFSNEVNEYIHTRKLEHEKVNTQSLD
ncbi:hypothetical protein RI543_002513 [Arxiozyma heterogenica]|uniref:BRO1 domain-containing protein n=1 Tax=Arxiozyma heterogenica TaxID=278026 RepID=A0AAN7WMU7_9SACH|nr:hypothetical protein RI543_002513 [Kazachstania heterogenica]